MECKYVGISVCLKGKFSMIPRKIQAPGVEINEIDVSQYNGLDLNDSTVILLNGFTDKGENMATKIVTSMVDFTNTYGYPTTEAERYLYNGVKQTLIHDGIPAITKIPYLNKSLSTYSCCTYRLGDTHTLSSITDILDIDKIFPAFSGIDYNLTSIYEIVENAKDLIERYLNGEGIDSLTTMYEIIDRLEEIDAELSMTGYDLTSVQEITDNLYALNKLIYDVDALSILNNSEQIRVFKNFVDGICDFNSFRFPTEVTEKINELLFGTINCFINMRKILIDGEQNRLSAYDFSNPEKVIYEVMRKNGYGHYEDFLMGLIASITKDEFIACIDDIDKTFLSSTITEDEKNLIKSLKYTDLAKINGMKTYIDIYADTELSSRYISFKDYDNYVIGNTLEVKKETNNSDTITIVDISRGKYEKDKLAQNNDLSAREYIGIVPVLVTAPNAMYWQGIINNTKYDNEFSCYNIVSEILATPDLTVPQQDLEVLIKAVSEKSITIGSMAETYFPKIEYFSPNTLDNNLFQKVGVVVFKMVIDTANNNLIDFMPVEAFVGSLNRKEKDLITNTTDYLEDIVNNSSQFINLFINISDRNMKKYMTTSTYLIKDQPAFSLGFSSIDCEKNISVKLIKDSLNLVFDHLQNPNFLKIDVVADCGMSNIAQYIDNTTIENIGKYEIGDSYNFLLKNKSSIQVWKSIIDLYDNFCRNIRKDCMFIADSPRNFCLLGNQKIVRRSNPFITVDKNIIPSIKFMVDFNTSYGAGYCNWFRCIDDTTRFYMWMPPTVKVIEAYLRTDNQYNFWDAPAGSRRGVMTETYDIAFNPAEKDAEKIYINRWNYAVAFPLEGILLEGQKTFQKNQTAFDRVNVRRLFLRVEKDVKRMARTFLYEPLTERNMMKFRDMVITYLQDIQTKDGIREFYVICDGRNNTNETMDNNELHCSIGIKPTKTLEFIVLNFICTNQSANVEEVTSQYI